MPKLTAEDRQRAKWSLQQRLMEAIEQSPRGLTDAEVRECVLTAVDKSNGLMRVVIQVKSGCVTSVNSDGRIDVGIIDQDEGEGVEWYEPDGVGEKAVNKVLKE